MDKSVLLDLGYPPFGLLIRCEGSMLGDHVPSMQRPPRRQLRRMVLWLDFVEFRDSALHELANTRASWKGCARLQGATRISEGVCRDWRRTLLNFMSGQRVCVERSEDWELLRVDRKVTRFTLAGRQLLVVSRPRSFRCQWELWDGYI